MSLNRPPMPLELRSTHLVSVQFVISSVAPHTVVTVNVAGDYIIVSPATEASKGKASRRHIDAGQTLTLWNGWHIYEATPIDDA